MVPVESEPFVVSGAGEGICEVRRHRSEDLEDGEVIVGTWAVVADDGLPEAVQGVRLARVTSIEAIPGELGFSRIRLEPEVGFAGLREVMVLSKP